jgi:uncharacterized protein
MADLRERIDEDLKQAMRARDERRLSVLRMIRAGVKNAEVAARKTLDEPGIAGVVSKEVNEHRDSLEEFRKAGRDDLVAKEEAELAILLEYQPEQLTRDQVAALVGETIAQTGASGAKDKGKLMSALMPQVRGKADGRMVNEVVTELLG